MIIKMATKFYKPSPTGLKFHGARNYFVRAIMGPFGSGKSVTCVLELLMIAYQQEPDRGYIIDDGMYSVPDSTERPIRRTRFAIIRNTYRELLDTTLKTFFDWIDKSTGHFSNLTMTFTLNQDLPDGTHLMSEFMFRALDKPDDISKLLSLEITAAWINEARELPLSVVEAVQGRCGRYPAVDIHQNATFHGVIMDTNPPDKDHWWYNLLEGHMDESTGEFIPCPSNHILLKQPSGLHPDAENLKNLIPDYYENLAIGKRKVWIDVYIHGKYGFVMDGTPVWPEYNDDVHFIGENFSPVPEHTIYVGLDFGLTPAAVFGQLIAGRLVIFDELVTFNMGAVNFGKLLKQRMLSYKGFDFEVYGDPAGDTRAQTDETTPYQVLYEQGVAAYPVYTNDFIIRRDTVGDLMLRLTLGGRAAFCITPGAPVLRKALSGGYSYRRMQVSGQERFKDVPDKNKFSHVADALQYLALGATGGEVIFAKSKTALSLPNTGIM
jgi:hypothetical protein